MRDWWVNHKQTFAHEVGRGYIWCPKRKQSGGNGLLLNPSIDHLFDRGFISFGDDGEVLRSPVADEESLRKIGIRRDEPVFAGRSNSEHRHLPYYHRKEFFLKSSI